MLEIRDISTVTHTYDYIITNYYVFLKLFLIALGLLFYNLFVARVLKNQHIPLLMLFWIPSSNITYRLTKIKVDSIFCLLRDDNVSKHDVLFLIPLFMLIRKTF